MIQSMTGYGKTIVEIENKKITVEIKSLNSKQMDLSVRLPSIYKDKELQLRNMLSKDLVRGKIDFLIYVETIGVASNNIINQDVLEAYKNQIVEAANKLNIPVPADWFSILLKLPDAMKYNAQEADEKEWQTVMQAVGQAIVDFQKFRKQEGEMLYNIFIDKIKNISLLLEQVQEFESGRLERIKERINDALEKIDNFNYDKNRFEQEMIYHIERLDINEEKSRLLNHLKYFEETMDNEVSQGRKLNFIAQEIGREINTLGSKSNDADMQKIVVNMKDDLEQIKEQVFNVL